MAKRKKIPHIMEFLKGIYNFENYDGLLFVGDPHLCSRKPGTRLDDNFMETVLDKLTQAVEIAKSNNLFMIILGDLLHDDEDHDPLMLTRLIQLFKKLPHPPLTIVGNHEKTQTKLTDDTFCAALREAGVMYTIEKTQYWGRFKFNNDYVYVGGTPYGQTIPTSVDNLIDKSLTEFGAYTIWLTHHDLAIDAYYPGCIEPFEITGCDMVVNGHDHTTKKPVIKGQTIYFNPGNITRMSVDKKDHVPSVWSWQATKKRELLQIPLKYRANVFDLTGRQVLAQTATPTKAQTKVVESKFLELLEQNVNTPAAVQEGDITTDASSMEQSIKALSAILAQNDEFTQEMVALAKECAKDLSS